VTTTFKAACMAKRKDLRVRGDNPCAGVLPPERGESRRRTFVYPNEVVTLLGCADVPIEWRELYAVACCLYLRPGELRALTWGDVDSDAGIVHVDKANDERSGEVKPRRPATGCATFRSPTLGPLLRRLSEGKKPKDRVLDFMSTWSDDQRAIKRART
jgi:integrase